MILTEDVGLARVQKSNAVRKRVSDAGAIEPHAFDILGHFGE
ncbi:MAG: hypothetical protein U5K43_10690 [Halofilum sp. (in: g-proteobacteria)]|nr:hypothetical protein [Halofilum sp. (in: g-proteobacteria)]